MAALWTEICLAMPVIHALGDGYEVYIVTDASGGVSLEAHEMAIQRMVQAGAVPITWTVFGSELQRDWARTDTVPLSPRCWSITWATSAPVSPGSSNYWPRRHRRRAPLRHEYLRSRTPLRITDEGMNSMKLLCVSFLLGMMMIGPDAHAADTRALKKDVSLFTMRSARRIRPCSTGS